MKGDPHDGPGDHASVDADGDASNASHARSTGDASPPSDRFHYRNETIEDILREAETGPAYCVRCGNASLDPDALAAHIPVCTAPMPDQAVLDEEIGLPSLRRPSAVRARERADVERPLWRRAVRRLRVAVDASFRRCETCPSFHPSAKALYADHPSGLHVVENGEGVVSLIPRREVRQWDGKIHGSLDKIGFCSQHDRGVFPASSCERWRA